MPKEIGEVISAGDDTAQIRFKRTSACAKCGACSHGQSEADMVLTVNNAMRAGLGDRVAVELAGRNLLFASLISYMVPLVFLIIGVLLGGPVAALLNIASADVTGAVLGILLAGLVFFILRLLDPVIKRHRAFYPYMTEIIEKRGE